MLLNWVNRQITVLFLKQPTSPSRPVAVNDPIVNLSGIGFGSGSAVVTKKMRVVESSGDENENGDSDFFKVRRITSDFSF